MMGPLLERYLSGDHEGVWNEMAQLRQLIRKAPLVKDSEAVARETMKRARFNIEALIRKLFSLGYEFGPPGTALSQEPFDNEYVYRQGSRELVRQLQLISSAGSGEIPLAVGAWFEYVGEVSLSGRHPILNPEGGKGDPLVVRLGPFEAPPQSGKGPRFGLLELKPNRVGRRFSVKLPDEGAGIELVRYLRTAFQWGGFPGWAESISPPREEITYLREGLIDL